MRQKTDQLTSSENMKENKYKYIIIALLSGTFFYILNVFTPYCSDDWHYGFIFGTLIPIQSVSDILQSQYYHYFQMNGRFVPHFFVQLFDGILGKQIFNIANACVFLLFIYLLVNKLKQYYQSTSQLLLLILFIIFFLIPGFRNCFLWMSGACNYLWVATTILAFDCLFKANKHIPVVILFIIGIICGWTNEAFCIGLSCGFVVYYVFHRNKLTTAQKSLISGFVLGTIMLVASPGSIGRALNNSDTGFNPISMAKNFAIAFLYMNNIRILPLLLVLALYLVITKRATLKGIIKEDLIWIVAIGVTFVFILFTRHDSSHSRFGFEFFSMILILKYLSMVRIPKLANTLILISLVIMTIYTIPFAYKNYEESNRVLSQLKKQKDSIIMSECLNTPTNASRFVIPLVNWYSNGMPFSGKNWENQMIAKRFQKKEIIFLPASIYQGMVYNNPKFKRFYTTPNIPFYVKQVNKKQISNVIFKLNPTDYDKLPFYIRPFANKMQRYSLNELQTEKYDVLTIEKKNYLFVKKNALIGNRLEKIIINEE